MEKTNNFAFILLHENENSALLYQDCGLFNYSLHTFTLQLARLNCNH